MSIPENSFEESIAIGDTVMLKDIHFRFNSYELEEMSFGELDMLYNYLKLYPELKVVIMGHTVAWEATRIIYNCLNKELKKLVNGSLIKV